MRIDFRSWNQHDNVLACLPRSAKLAKGWHNGFRCVMGCSNPNIWRLIKEQDLKNWINQPEDDETAPSSSTEEVEGLRQTLELHHHVLR